MIIYYYLLLFIIITNQQPSNPSRIGSSSYIEFYIYYYYGVVVFGCQQQREGTHILYRLALSTRMLRQCSNKISLKEPRTLSVCHELNFSKQGNTKPKSNFSTTPPARGLTLHFRELEQFAISMVRS